MKRLSTVFVCTVMLFGLSIICGCEDDYQSNRIMEPVQTEITPSVGGYSINTKGSFRVVTANVISYSYDGYAHYDVPIHNGGISFSNGRYYWMLSGEKVDMLDGSGNAYPTDGFAIWAQWTSPNHCEGIFWDSPNEGVPFSASK